MNEEIISDECINCPMCKHEHYEWWEYTDFEKDEQTFDLNCENCDWFFIVEVRVQRKFESKNFGE
jgi:transcription elongation factor Elf1